MSKSKKVNGFCESKSVCDGKNPCLNISRSSSLNWDKSSNKYWVWKKYTLTSATKTFAFLLLKAKSTKHDTLELDFYICTKYVVKSLHVSWDEITQGGGGYDDDKRHHEIFPLGDLFLCAQDFWWTVFSISNQPTFELKSTKNGIALLFFTSSSPVRCDVVRKSHFVIALIIAQQ